MGPWGRFVDSVASKLAFFPPSPSSYAVRKHADSTGDQYIHPTMPGLMKVPNAKVTILETHTGSKIVTALISFSASCRPVILFSHGNAVDLGLMLPFLRTEKHFCKRLRRELGRDLKCDMMGYDYSGYGESSGIPTVANTIADIDACYKWLLQLGKRPEDIVLYGQSVGSGPSCDLGAREPKLGGVILHSPLATGMQVVSPTWKWWPGWADVYVNTRLVPKIQAPVLVMHGSEDEVIDQAAGRTLAALARVPAEHLWAEGCTHQDLELHPLYLPRLRTFIQARSSQRRAAQ